MAKFLRKFISSCVVCQTRNPMASTKLGKLQTIPIPARAFSTVCCDTGRSTKPDKLGRPQISFDSMLRTNIIHHWSSRRFYSTTSSYDTVSFESFGATEARKWKGWSKSY
ncbi:hypothetical protein BV898_15141 [Hypsibius exemplaris]|uniref:Uncharacterized protein n=1 Tax=Hypsibius exemplaris TaxID=2072580 RepID=A0A9X6RKE8_HYPEX|nr:hypothetical protein BV898_15141 [Hypsibius exemplaris]